MMGTLVSYVVNERLELSWRDGLGPVADLPFDEGSGWRESVQRPTRSPLEVVDERRDGDPGRMLDEHMNVIESTARGKDRAVETPPLSFEESEEPRVQARFDGWRAMAGRPGDVDDQHARGVCTAEQEGSSTLMANRISTHGPRKLRKFTNETRSPGFVRLKKTRSGKPGPAWARAQNDPWPMSSSPCTSMASMRGEPSSDAIQQGARSSRRWPAASR